MLDSLHDVWRTFINFQPGEYFTEKQKPFQKPKFFDTVEINFRLVESLVLHVSFMPVVERFRWAESYICVISRNENLQPALINSTVSAAADDDGECDRVDEDRDEMHSQRRKHQLHKYCSVGNSYGSKRTNSLRTCE